jgi:hypothetical protein
MESWPRPPERRLAFLASVGLHLLFVLYWMGTLVGPRPPQRSLIEPPAATDTMPVVIDLTYVPDAGPTIRLSPPAGARAERPSDRSTAGPVPQYGIAAARDQVPEKVPSGIRQPPAASADTATAPDEYVDGHIAPQYARGRLWVRPLPLPPRELAQRLTGSRKALADSAVNRAVQAYLDSVAADPNAPKAMPSWTTQLAGKTFGVDSKYLYIAGLKIPAAVLALLPIVPAGANYDRDQAWRQMMDLRADIQQAAMRSANKEEFKKAIKEIRERKARAEEFQRNQGTAPERGSPAASPPSPPPSAAAKPDLTPTP